MTANVRKCFVEKPEVFDPRVYLGQARQAVKDMVEHKFPIANRINPACLISDCFYSLNVYENYDRFFRNISIMGLESVILLTAAFILLRREKYASL